ncbi:MAG: ferredoxin [Hyphococcus sp.]|nr:MAG: ferredoxin [Marinicaulis sp.]
MDKAAGTNASGGVERINVEPINSPENRTLYKAREAIYPKRVSGKYRRLKWVIMVLTLGVYYILPWVRWERGANEPDQAILVDFAGSRFYFFAIEIWPDELYYVTGLLILAALGLFLATALFGRIWCGYTCPQTVWTDLYIAVERMIEGDRNKRMKLDKAPWSTDKIMKKVSKHTIWILIGMATGGAWIFYFHDAPTIAAQFFKGQAPFTAYFYCALLTMTTYIFAGSMREQVCTYMCPWPRIQAALTDEDTLQVTYKKDRGEPRGPHKKGDSWDGRGDCVSCRACVAACPMGIDIREGAQLECINCALCIDACDDIMAKVDRPLSLIGYDTDANMARREAGEKPKFNYIRPRILVYSVMLVLVASVMSWTLFSRATVNLNVIRDRTPPFVKLSDGSVRNAYTVKIVNRDNVERTFLLDVKGPPEMVVSAAGDNFEENNHQVVVLDDSVRSIRLFVTLPPEALDKASLPISVTARDIATGEEALNPTTFITGGR